MRELLHHLVGSCGESHISLLMIVYTGIIAIYKDYLLAIIKGVKDVLFK
jgi:hypothetical protein|tara:strand:- start:929 stop:1075 length:147 start_codon:yes stop_codon:yes gene_type:complete